MKKHLKSLALAGAALLLAGSVTVGTAMAYFTTYATASGGAEVSLGFTTTEPGEQFIDGAKHIVIENTGDYDCFVRVRILFGDKYKDYVDVHGENWETREGDGGNYYYYKNPLLKGKKTPNELLAEIKVREMEFTDDFNVIVVQECTPVLYDESGNPYADWDVILDTKQDSYN